MRYQEEIIQKTVVYWLRNQYPDMLFTCAPAVAKSARQGRRNKMMGYCKGWPDLFIAEPRGSYHGLAIELKTLTGKISDEQDNILTAMKEKGYAIDICRSADEAILSIKSYLKKK